MNQVTLIFPHQLFEAHPGLSHSKSAYLVEDPLFFFDQQRKIKFHKKKLVLHRASMLYYKEKLETQGFKVHYIPYQKSAATDDLFQRFVKDQIRKIWVADVVDSELDKRLSLGAHKANIELEFLPTPGFLTDCEWLKDFLVESKHYSQTRFYIAQRKRLDVLVEKGKPVGGQWSFDPLNRRKIPKGTPIPEIASIPENAFLKEAQEYVKKNFPSHPGKVEGFLYPVTHVDSRIWLDDFLYNKLDVFGDYEDAMVHDESFLFHSVLTPSLNVGLICPKDVLERTLAFVEKHPIPVNSLEGFIRQVIGWREFMRAIYILEGERERTSNFWGHRQKIPDSFYTATTGIGPVDTVIERVIDRGYAHHIERLMVLGNFMLLCEIAPRAVYRWFMEMFIDAYDWVMVPNVFGMSQFADGGLITTKPYISSSRYIQKMSDFPKGEWCTVWDALYWRFIDKHRDFFTRNPRMRVMTFQLEKMDEKVLKKHHLVADRFLKNL
ncbi:MAG: cryptochrome/photolyase family protein [Candidatus Aminicenantes bacterium]|jgi:deoxyribodipyrimidine photolyase-related protein